jgi:hypothetical protein
MDCVILIVGAERETSHGGSLNKRYRGRYKKAREQYSQV